MALSVAPSTNSAPVVGSATPRLATPPLRELTPATSYGFDVIDFADRVLGITLDPWEREAAIRMGELLPDGRPRFRMVLIIVARQNGKTLLCRVLTLYWMFIEQHPMILGTSSSREYAKESWRKVIEMAQANHWLSAELDARAVRQTIGEEEFRTTGGSRYRFSAANRKAGRSLTIHRLIMDELREHHTWDTYRAAVAAMNAVADAQAVAITNQGDARAVVLESLRADALDCISRGDTDTNKCLLEWSAEPGADPCDPHALAQANPNLGTRIDVATLLAEARRAVSSGGEELATFRTEILCQKVESLVQSVDHESWDASACESMPDLSEHRDKVALCLDVSLDRKHATLVACAVIDDVAYLEVVKSWNGAACLAAVRTELGDIIRRVRPKRFGWFPNGPAASISPALRKEASRMPRGTTVEELAAELTAVSMGFADRVLAGQVRHPGDELLTAHVKCAGPKQQGDGWVFSRRKVAASETSKANSIDGAYAAAGALHMALTLPPPRAKLRVL